ncbi:hypothetical protein, partial [Desulfuromonas acetoxidans]|uniref:hypothetical protein n=1 Tax=Desulfuromonas acetoxidans TaxID=891 RepID=UPI001A7EAF81
MKLLLPVDRAVTHIVLLGSKREKLCSLHIPTLESFMPLNFCALTVHDNRRRREARATTAILDFAFWPKAEA